MAAIDDGHWPDQIPAARIRQFGDDVVLRVYRTFRPRKAATPPDFLHVAGLCDPVSISELPTSTPTVTAIVLNRDGAEMLDTLFSSIHRINRYPNLDIVLVDHGSSDGSLAVAAKWSDLLCLTIVRCSENHSFSFSCNRAAERATGEYLLLLNNDLELVDDIIGPMVAMAARHRGMVACKLVKNDGPRGMAPTILHIGVRFNWHTSRRLTGAYEATPKPGDERIAQEPSRFLAVTAAASLCRREDYIEVGGMWEEYIYGFEDVDLNLKFALGLGRRNVCLNNVSVIHRGGATRKHKVSRARQRSWFENNVDLLNRRFGYALRRTILQLLFTDDGSLWGRRARVGFELGRHREAMSPILDELGRRYHWTIRRDPDGELRGLDLLVVADPDFRLKSTRHRHPMMLRVAWIVDRAREWESHDLAVYDLVFAKDALAKTLCAHGETVITILDPTAPIAAKDLVARVLEYLTTRHRIAIKCADSADTDIAVTLAREFRVAGHFARIDQPDLWQCQETMRDDVVILLPRVRNFSGAPGKILIACDASASAGAIDARLSTDLPAALAATILDMIAKLHSERLCEPRDRPLVPLPAFTKRIVDGWGNSMETRLVQSLLRD